MLPIEVLVEISMMLASTISSSSSDVSLRVKKMLKFRSILRQILNRSFFRRCSDFI